MKSLLIHLFCEEGNGVLVPFRNREVMRTFDERGVQTKETPFEIAETSDVVITMLPSSSHVSL